MIKDTRFCRFCFKEKAIENMKQRKKGQHGSHWICNTCDEKRKARIKQNNAGMVE